jgi:curved DNA-binding protein
MALEYKDYYQVLGVSRDATPEQIKHAFRKLARQHHPDRNKGARQSEERFKEINEANEVLSDPEKRRRYDALGSNWRPGQTVDPDDFMNMFGGRAGRTRSGGQTFTFQTGGGAFSDFFEALFGGGMGGIFSQTMGGQGTGTEGAEPFDPFAGAGGRPERAATSTAGADVNASLTISLEEAYRGTTRRMAFQRADPRTGRATHQDYEVKIPAGITPGQKIRLKGQGSQIGSRTGDIILTVQVAPHPRYHLSGSDLSAELALAPWEAALGGRVSVETMDGPIDVRVPAGTISGKQLRVRGRGFPNKEGGRGDLYLKAQIHVPDRLGTRERELFEELARVSGFNPRRS